METLPSFKQVTDHLDQVLADPSVPLDALLLRKLGLEAVDQTDHQLFIALITQISRVLPVLQEDPSPLTALAGKISTFLGFEELQSIDPAIDLLAGIKAPNHPINLLTLLLIGKASESPSYVAVIAESLDLVTSIVELWLSTDSTEVAQAAGDVLCSLLECDRDGLTSGHESLDKPSSCQGIMWRRVFKDKSIYSLLFSLSSLDGAGVPGRPTARQISVAQGRLLDFVSKIASIDWEAVTTSHIPEVEGSFKSSSLLNFAALHMVDTEDLLLHMTLLHFYCQMLQINAPGLRQRNKTSESPGPSFSSPALEFLISTGVHRKVMDYYMVPSALDPAVATYFSGPIMSYVAQYSILYPNHLLQESGEMLDKLLSRIRSSFEIPTAQWAHGAIPSGDLNILASLPRVLLLEAEKKNLNPLLSIPSKPLHKDSLDAIGRIFNGPPPASGQVDVAQEKILEQNPTSPRAEAAAARILFFQYLNIRPDIWNNVVEAADTLAMQDNALAAVKLIKAVATANWAVISPNEETQNLTSGPFGLPTEGGVSHLGPAAQGTLPTSGSWALLVPPSLTVVLPYLFKAPQTYANYVAGGAQDKESAVWRIATAKYDALVSFQSAVEKIETTVSGIADIKRTLRQRVAEGPMGASTQIGSRVEALDL
ncbi:hypothetical protein FQN57_005435 [Myotisia sp. PD_48]|nr:hypothetical protein FQN57_005435 [Myotisia sp. PD_48]